MSEREFGCLRTHEGRNSILNISPTSVGGTPFSMVIFGAPPPINFQPVTAPKLKGKKRVAPTSMDVLVGAKWLDAAIANIINLDDEE